MVLPLGSLLGMRGIGARQSVSARISIGEPTLPLSLLGFGK
jgi:hypothetical protein